MEDQKVDNGNGHSNGKIKVTLELDGQIFVKSIDPEDPLLGNLNSHLHKGKEPAEKLVELALSSYRSVYGI